MPSPFRIAHGDIGACFLGCRADAVGVGAGAQHRVVIVDLPVIPACLGAAAHGEAVGQAVGVAGDQRFGKYDQLRAVSARLADLGAYLVNGGVLVEHHRGGLYQRHAQLLLQVFHSGQPSFLCTDIVPETSRFVNLLFQSPVSRRIFSVNFSDFFHSYL